MDFIDRKNELSRLHHLANIKGSGMAVVWGRRRMGKTRLLLEWAHKYKLFRGQLTKRKKLHAKA